MYCINLCLCCPMVVLVSTTRGHHRFLLVWGEYTVVLCVCLNGCMFWMDGCMYACLYKGIYVCMDRWIDEWWVDGRLYVCIFACMNVWMYRWMVGSMVGWMDSCKDGWLDECCKERWWIDWWYMYLRMCAGMDGWMDHWMDEWLDG